MTKREFLNKIATFEDVELATFAQEELEKMDRNNEKNKEKRKEKPSKTAEENQPLIDRIMNEILTIEPTLAADVAAVLEVTTQKASSLCRAAVAQGEGKIGQTEVKVKGKGMQKAYYLIKE